jgi:mRNA-degrading endonuclease YafQ of YafQ-DinJ toxin-antitoxin module
VASLNDVVATGTFKRLFRRKSNRAPRELLVKIEGALLALRESVNPEFLGPAKRGRLVGLFAYELDRENRILFRVIRRRQETAIQLLRVCSHKEVYGKD